MSQETVEIVQAIQPPTGTELTNLFANTSEAPGPLEAAAPLFHAEFEFSAPMLGASHRLNGRGLVELGDGWRDWLEPWELYWTEVEDFIDVGDQVLVLLRDHGRLRGSEAEVEQLGANLWTVRDRKIAQIDFFLNRDEALEAAGLSE